MAFIINDIIINNKKINKKAYDNIFLIVSNFFYMRDNHINIKNTIMNKIVNYKYLLSEENIYN